MDEEPGLLAEAAARGDEAAIGALLARHLPGLRAFVRLRAGPVVRARESSSDLVQSVCREVLEHAGRFRHPSDRAFKRWLYTEALRKIAHRAEHWRAEKRDAGREVALDAARSADGDEMLLACYASLSTPSRNAVAREEIERFERAFEALSEEHREAITLAHLVGLSRQEIAEQMGRSEVAVRSLLYRGMAQLAERLGAGAGEGRAR